MTVFKLHLHETVEMMHPQTPFLVKTETVGIKRFVLSFLYRGALYFRHLCIFKWIKPIAPRACFTAASFSISTLAFVCRVFAGRVAVALRQLFP
jgi:hypothetical protein